MKVIRIWRSPICLALAGIIFGTVLFFGFGAVLRRFWISPQLLSVHPSEYRCAGRVGDKVQASYSVTNVTSGRIRVLGMRSSCSCTRASDSVSIPFDLSPGESVQFGLDVVLGEPNLSGSFRRSVDLFVDREGFTPSLLFDADIHK